MPLERSLVPMQQTRGEGGWGRKNIQVRECGIELGGGGREMDGYSRDISETEMTGLGGW